MADDPKRIGQVAERVIDEFEISETVESSFRLQTKPATFVELALHFLTLDYLGVDRSDQPLSVDERTQLLEEARLVDREVIRRRVDLCPHNERRERGHAIVGLPRG